MSARDRASILKSLLEIGEPFVIASVYDSKSSSDLRTGDCFGMDRTARFHGTATAELKEFLMNNMTRSMRLSESFRRTFEQSRADAASHGATCGQRSSFLFQYAGPEPIVHVFGAGDLAVLTSRMLALAGFSVVVADSDTYFLERVTNFCEVRKIDFNDESSFPNIAGRDFCIVMTRGHLEDVRVLRFVLKSQPRYIGMIGSIKKNIEVRKRLEEMGVNGSQWNRIKTPIGLDIGASAPGEIAVAIAAEIVHVKNSGRNLEDT